MSKHSRAYLSAGAVVALIVACGPRAGASGFQLREQSASSQGVSYAGVSAGGTDISSMFYNPAGMVRYDGLQIQIGLTDILPSSEFSSGSATRATSPALPPLPSGTSTISGDPSTGNAARSAVTPTLYVGWAPTKDLRLGLAVNVPFGLTTQYDDTWIGRYHGIRSHLETIDIAPTAAYRFSDQFSGGLAFVARRAKADLSQALDLGYEAWSSIQQVQAADPSFNNTNPYTQGPVVAPGAADGIVSVSGDAWAYGFRAGFLFEPTQNLRIGVGYQSAMNETIKGTATFTVPSSIGAGMQVLAQLNPGAQQQIELQQLQQGFAMATADGPVSAELNLPACATLGLAWDFSPTFTLNAEYQRTTWSRFKDLTLQFDNAAQAPNVTQENWKDTNFVSLGADCHPAGPWSYRIGVAFDQTPVEDAYRTPRIPDADRTWVSAGVGYRFAKNFAMDFAYTHIFAKDSTVNLEGGQDPTSSDFYKGNLSGTYKNSIDILALQARWSF
jgi:long-chain fatty acid transport protein